MNYRYVIILALIVSVVGLTITGIYFGGNAKSITLEDTTNFVIYQTKITVDSIYYKITGNHIFHQTSLDECTKFKYMLLKEVRLPPIIGAILVGLTLSACGLMLQTLFRNLLASPYTTGISSGVLFAVALVIFINSFAELFSSFGTDKIMVAGWCGGLLSIVMLIIIALRIKEVNGVLIVALLMSYLFEGIRAYLIANGTNLSIQDYFNFIVGNVTRIHLNDIPPMVICTIIFTIGCIFLIKPLNALLFGETYAKSFGLNVKKSRILILLLTSFIVGAIIPYVGLMAFVGIAAPYLARPIIRTSDHRWLLPTTMLVGVVLMLMCHIISLKYWVPIFYIYGLNRPAQVLPIGSILDVLGGLLVIYLVYKGEKKIKIQ
ncbi:iron ABC transporter permease [Methanothermococcus sp.]|uniref:FecCD family ABC transporter permease n=1 Tax=Methanothermococcus sp. TaxID=2614238 RepID=UPI0025F07EB3|nr:iron ABC transporter permease [Methanothermococcus sp.]